jgi:phosphomannomutase
LQVSVKPSIFKAYDVRGLYPEELDEAAAYEIGKAAAQVLVVEATQEPKKFLVGRDMRPSGESLVQAFAQGVISQGVDVVLLGLTSSDELYFATGKYQLPGAMFTASHNPARYNGIKFAKAGAAPVGQETGLAEIADRVLTGGSTTKAPGKSGTISELDVLPDYVAYLRQLVPLQHSRSLKVVVDAGNGMAGLTMPAVMQGLPIEIVPLYFELDGTFPNHDANPIEPTNLMDLQKAVVEHAADLGIAFDGDADRAFLVDERGIPITPSAVTALIAARELTREPGAAVIHNLITSRAVPEVVAENGGVAVKTRVGHSFIKQRMAETGAIFGGEHSGHFYFRDFWRADSGMLAAMHVLAALGETDAEVTASQLMRAFERYVASGEINTQVRSPSDTVAKVKSAYELVGLEIDEMDGVTVASTDWWFNVRPSNTEPLVRLNVEASTQAEMVRLRDEVLALIRDDAN